jgi:WD40-like Beta Propeller Repeat
MDETGAQGFFPATDEEPARRFTARRVRWAVAGVLAAGLIVGFLSWPQTSAPLSHRTSAPFREPNGLVILVQQPSGALGVAHPDGSNPQLLSQLGALQGVDSPVESPGGHYLVNDEGQVVTLGRSGPVSVAPTAMTTQLQGTFGSWQGASFAGGGRFIVAAECSSSVTTTPWRARIAPVEGGGTGTLLGLVDEQFGSGSVVGDPKSEGAFVVPGSPIAQSTSTCQAPPPAHGDTGVLLERPGHPASTVITAAKVLATLGASAGTPVLLGAYPSPDGSVLAVTAATFSSKYIAQGRYIDEQGLGLVVVTRTGQVTAKLTQPAGNPVWSADGKQIAYLGAGRSGTVQVWPLSGQPRAIRMPVPAGDFPLGLIWSPDGTQLMYAVDSSKQGLTASSNTINGWTVLDLRTGHAHTVNAPGQPVAWLS